jgi:colanic acid/amylovoran biosynthesis glycosyltransferase
MFVAHYRSTYLPLTETFIHRYVEHLSVERFVITEKRINKGLFPFRSVEVCASGEWPTSLAKRLAWRLERATAFVGLEPEAALRERLTASVVGILRRRGANVLHAHFGVDAARVQEAAYRVETPLVASFYGYDASVSSVIEGQSSYRQLIQRAAAFLAEGPNMRERLVRLGCPREKVHIQPIAIDCTQVPFRPPHLPSQGSPVVLLGVGRLVEKKGFEYAIQALADVRASHPETELRLIGDGPLREGLETLAREHGVSGAVRFLGWRDYRDYLREAEQAHILVCPSVEARSGDSEGGAPTVLLELQAMGKPIVATRHADIPSVVAEGDSALLCQERDARSLAEAIGTLIEAPARWEAMGAAGRAFVEERHEVTRLVPRLESIYEMVCAGTSPRPASLR